MFGGLEGNGLRWNLAWSDLMVGWALFGILVRVSLASGRVSRKGSCVFGFLEWFKF